MFNKSSNHPETLNCSSKAIIYLLFQCATLVLNTIAAVTLWRLKDHKMNISHLVVRVLVVSDALGSLITMIPIVMSCTKKAALDRVICSIFGYLSSVFLLWTALIVLLLCTMRYLALVRPLFYRTYLTYRIIQYILVCEFFWSAAHLMLPLFGIGRFKFYPNGQYCAFEIKPSNANDTILVHITVWEGWLTILILLCFTVRMLLELRAKKKLASRLSFQQRRGVRASGNRQQGYTLMTVVIVAIFLICYIPFLMYRMLALINKHVREKYHYHLHLLANLNPLINPVIYVAFNKSYRKSVQTLFKNLCCCFAASVNKLSKSSSISMVLFSTSSDDSNRNSERRQRAVTTTSSSFLTVPLHVPRVNQAPMNNGKSRHRRCFSDDISSILPQANAPKSFSEKPARRKETAKANINKSFDVDADYLDLPRSPRGKPRGLSLSSISALVSTPDAKNSLDEDGNDDVFLPGTVEDSTVI